MIIRIALAALLTTSALTIPQSLAQSPAPRVKPEIENHSRILSDGDFPLYRAGIQAAQDNEWNDVRTARYQLENPIAKKVLLWRMALGDASTSFSELDLAMDELTGWPQYHRIQQEAEWKITDSGMSPALTAQWFEDHAPISGEGKVAYGEALIALGQRDEGRAMIRDAWHNNQMRLSFQNDVLRNHGDMFDRADHAERVDFLIWAGQRTAASRLLSHLSENERRLATARIQLASRSRGVDNAVAAVPDSLTNDPGLLYERARWRRRAGYDDNALPLLLELPDSYQNNDALELMWTERKLMILNLIRDRDFETAYRLAAANGMSAGVDFADAEFLAGWLALVHLNNGAQAQLHFEKLEAGVSTAVSLSRAIYWQGRAAEQQAHLDEAREKYLAAAQHNTTYYGQLAILALGADAAVLDLPPEPDPDEETRARFEAHEQVQALHLLSEFGEDYFFRVFIYHLDDELTDPAEHALLADLALDSARIRQSVRAAKAARMQGYTLTTRAYPVIDIPEAAPVLTESALAHSVIRQETEFDPRAVSHAGARGMMQMMPATARQTARQIRQPYNFQWLTDDPDYNLTLGMAHLQEVVDNYDGSLVMALAAYNAGGHRVRRWVESYGDPRSGAIDPIDWVESIPFSETRNYVMRVLENLQVYRSRLNGDQPSLLFLERDMVGNRAAGQLDLTLPETQAIADYLQAQAAEAEAQMDAMSENDLQAMEDGDAMEDEELTDEAGEDRPGNGEG